MTTIIQLEKCRLGSTGTFDLRFNGKCSRFENIEDENAPFPHNATMKPNKDDTPF